MDIQDIQEKDILKNNKIENLKIRIPTPKSDIDFEEDVKSKNKKYLLIQSIFCCFCCFNDNK